MPTSAQRWLTTLAPWLMTLALGAASLALCGGQRPPALALTPEISREVVGNTIKALDKYYVTADGAKKLHEELNNRLDSGAYDSLASAYDLLDALDEQLFAISGDAHLKMAYRYEPGPPVKEIGDNILPETPQERAESLEGARRANFGFEKVARLPGNVGLLELGSFVRPEFSGETAGNAMSFLSGTDALIIDLRNTRGGSPDMVVFLASYFFPGDESYHLGDWYTRVEGGTQQCWTYPYLPGARYLGKDVYILTSRGTFSAPEGLAAFLQHHKKATVVGETTAGGTHPVVRVRVHPNFVVCVPVSMPVYPTGTPSAPLARPIYPERQPDVAGTGVKPDIEASSERALRSAHLAALRSLLAKHPDRESDLASLIEKLDAALQAPPAPSPAQRP